MGAEERPLRRSGACPKSPILPPLIGQARLQEFLRKEGYHIPEKPVTAAAASPALPTVDVLAEISAHSLPLGSVRVTQVRRPHAHAHSQRHVRSAPCVTSAESTACCLPTFSRRCIPLRAPP